MKCLFLILAMALSVLSVTAQADSLKPVKAEYVCMINNMAFDKPQIAIKVDGKTYYGCCPMCKERLEKDAGARKAIDPVSGREVDKADAVIGAAADGKVYYFETEANMRESKPSDTPQTHDHSAGGKNHDAQ